MAQIITLTVNPVVDKTTTVDLLVPNRKLRCTAPKYFPGGGGINVSRAIQNLGGETTAIYLAGGASGLHMQQLMASRGIGQKVIQQEGRTRENLSVTEIKNNTQYRFGVPGAFVSDQEWKSSISILEAQLKQGDFLVASGKLPPGIPTDYFAQIAAIAREKGAKFILDTKGEGLKAAITSPIFLLKPNLGELSALLGMSFIPYDELEGLALRFMADHSCELMVVSMGAKGALLVTQGQCIFIPAPMVHQKNRIGAGDSMVAGMTLGCVQGKSFLEMAQYGVACGTAATIREDGELCQQKDVNELYGWVKSHTKTLKKT
ncbi:1-phosphofructokinase family hexose kinase [Sediminicola sp. 1XM1-17]|uniref:1-phosphofructokinase family hexose kinase n=1 Tax=Sediminicola sp. 1XM1-17 TaxID=3127702 RepID=UPI00307749AC